MQYRLLSFGFKIQTEASVERDKRGEALLLEGSEAVS